MKRRRPTPLLERAAKSLGAHRPLVIGDRLDTDIAGADRRPTYIGQDLLALHQLP